MSHDFLYLPSDCIKSDSVVFNLVVTEEMTPLFRINYYVLNDRLQILLFIEHDVVGFLVDVSLLMH